LCVDCNNRVPVPIIHPKLHVASAARFDPPADSPPSRVGSKETVSQIRDAPVGKVQGLHNERAAHLGLCESSKVCFLSLRDYTIENIN
jgi:hypothetical protein